MKTVVALYDQISDANAAVRDLVDFGIPRDNISLMASDASGNYSSYLSGQRTDEVVSETMDSTASGAATGAGIGALVGGLGGLLVGLGVLAVPGVGPVLAAGPLATAISAITGAGVGAMAGGAAGGLIGALVDLGLPEETAGNYAEGVRRGGTLLTVRTEDQQAEEARRIMNRHNVVNLDERVRGWRDQGWTGYKADLNTDRDVQSTGVSTTPYTAGTHTENARHANEGMYGGEVSPDESGQRHITSTQTDFSDEYRASGPGSTPYTEGTHEEHATHPEGGMYGGVNAPDEDGARNRDAYTRSELSDLNRPSAGVNSYDTGVSGRRFDWESDTRYRNYDNGFQTHYTTNFANRGHDYDYYRPAYYYGYQLASDERYRGWNWQDIEPEARRDWERQGYVQGAWEDFKDAVQHAWMRVKEGVRETFD